MTRGAARLAVAVGAAFALFLPTSPAGAEVTFESVQNGTLTMSSDAEDYIGQGQSYSFATPANLFFARSQQGGSQLTVTVRPDAVDTVYWSLDFAAPSGQQLLPGTYVGAERTTSRSFGKPGLDVNGDYRGCNVDSGTFTVLEASYEPSGYVERFHATFEQHCEGGAPALRGEVDITNPPPPPPITAKLTLDGNAQLSARGSAIVHGTISCNREPDPSMSTINLHLSEQTKKGIVDGYAAFSFGTCNGTPVPWTATVTPVDPRYPFVRGMTAVTASATLRDPFYGEYVYGDPITGNAFLRES